MNIYILFENEKIEVCDFKSNRFIFGFGEFKGVKFLLRFKTSGFNNSDLYEIDMSKFNNNFMKKVKYCYYDVTTDSYHPEVANYRYLKNAKITNTMLDYLEDKIDDLLLDISLKS